MALDPRRRQKKAERRNAKQREKRKELARRQSDSSLPALIERAATCPILHACTLDTLRKQGIGQVLISRELPGGKVAFATFLLDVYCLGVKDVFFNVAPRAQYDWKMYGKLAGMGKVIHLRPESARKLIEGAVEYARGHGLSPHPDYQHAKAIFGNLDAAASTEEFAYGKDGKPYFIAGPNDSAARCRYIMDTLTARYGDDGFHFLMPVTAAGIDVEDLELLPESEGI